MAPIKKPKPILGKHYLKEWREARGVGQQDAASAITLSRTMLSKIENGEHPYQQQYVEGLARLYRCSPPDLIGVNPVAMAQDSETKLRSALLAYGVDKGLLDAALLAVEGFRVDSADDEPPLSPHDQGETASANPLREKVRSK